MDVTACLLYHIVAIFLVEFEIIMLIYKAGCGKSVKLVLTRGLRSGCIRRYPLLVMAKAYPCIPNWRGEDKTFKK